jgi:broad specificity phosphatase PhoE
MLEIYLARHGQNQDNADGILNGHRDLPLTAKGIAQAHDLAEQIQESELSFSRIFSSPLQRALHTAQIISSSGAGPAPEVVPGLIERDFGIMTGVGQSRIQELCAPDILQTDGITYFLNPEGGETFPDLLVRADGVLRGLDSSIPDGRILVVGHGDFGKMMYAAYYGVPWESVLTQFHFGNSELLLLSPNSRAQDAHVFFIEQHNL